MTNLRKILEEYRKAEWICTNDKSDTDEKINHRLDLAHQQILALIPKKKDRDWAGGGNDKWMYEELRKEGYNKALQEVKEALSIMA